MNRVIGQAESSPIAAFQDDPRTPRWAKDVLRYLPLKSQFLLTGNVRDWYPFPDPSGPSQPHGLGDYLDRMLRLAGFDYVLAYDIADGFYALGPTEGDRRETRAWAEELDVPFADESRPPASLGAAREVIERLVAPGDMANAPAVAVVIDYASRILPSASSIQAEEHDFFVHMLKLSHEAATRPVRPLGRSFHTVFWIADRETDLPSWAFGENDQVRIVPIPLPDLRVRRLGVDAMLDAFADVGDLNAEEIENHASTFVQLTEGLSLREVIEVADLADQERLGLKDVREAVRRYKVGIPEDPWTELTRSRIAEGEKHIGRRVKGQNKAIVKAMDIIKRAMTGLAGAQASSSEGRPKGVMFLAGPTGVGKTELAKALTELLFGDEDNMVRFDMSEFSAEHAAARLLGAPPGYVGYEAGGELINAIREKPVALVLFDEIEKAHPRILDKFLQLLDEGVLTSGRGERVYFSDCLIVFTSNLGILRRDERGKLVLNVEADDPDREERIVEAIQDYFKFELGRPEILNRIGENIVVFDFIRRDVAAQIFDKMLGEVIGRLGQKRITLELTSSARETLLDRCTSKLDQGGRGIGNKLEEWFINPLARALFDGEIGDGSAIRVTAISESGGSPAVSLQRLA